MTEVELSEIFSETEDIMYLDGYKNLKGEWISLEQEHLKNHSKFYVTVPALQKTYSLFKTKITVENKDTLQKAQELGSNVAVLNMASFVEPGGGVIVGAKSQEEELCRRSNLYLSLSKFEQNAEKDNKIENHYPIPLFGGIYSPKVSVFRSILSYSLLNSPFLCNVISVPAVMRPTIDSKTGDMIEKYEIIMRGKIRAIFRIALLNGHTNLVLGAMGCGAYGCPSEHVARLFKEVMNEKEFKNHFENICFAIIEDQNSHGAGNIKSFKKIFGK